MDKKEVLKKVEAALDTVRPYLLTDGGNIKVADINEQGELIVELLGACKTCPQSFMTMKAGVEDAVIKAVPSITAVKTLD